MIQNLKQSSVQLKDNSYLTFNGKGFMEFKGEKSDGTIVVAVFDVSDYTPAEAHELFKQKLEENESTLNKGI